MALTKDGWCVACMVDYPTNSIRWIFSLRFCTPKIIRIGRFVYRRVIRIIKSGWAFFGTLCLHVGLGLTTQYSATIWHTDKCIAIVRVRSAVAAMNTRSVCISLPRDAMPVKISDCCFLIINNHWLCGAGPLAERFRRPKLTDAAWHTVINTWLAWYFQPPIISLDRFSGKVTGKTRSHSTGWPKKVTHCTIVHKSH